jgi:hypothetical protein
LKLWKSLPAAPMMITFFFILTSLFEFWMLF